MRSSFLPCLLIIQQSVLEQNSWYELCVGGLATSLVCSYLVNYSNISHAKLGPLSRICLEAFEIFWVKSKSKLNY